MAPVPALCLQKDVSLPSSRAASGSMMWNRPRPSPSTKKSSRHDSAGMASMNMEPGFASCVLYFDISDILDIGPPIKSILQDLAATLSPRPTSLASLPEMSAPFQALSTTRAAETKCELRLPTTLQAVGAPFCSEQVPERTAADRGSE